MFVQLGRSLVYQPDKVRFANAKINDLMQKGLSKKVLFEKAPFRLRLKIRRTTGASLSLRGEGPHQLPQKRSLALLSILQSLAAAETVNELPLRNFRRPANFEFFSTIARTADLSRTSPNVGFVPILLQESKIERA